MTLQRTTSTDRVTRVAIAVVRRGNEFVVGIRPPDVPLAGKAEFPGGKIEPGETSEEAAVRECLEECGLQVAVRGEYFSTNHRYEHGELEIHFLDCYPLDRTSAPLPPFHWVSLEELKNLDFPEANAPLTRRLLEDCGKLV